MNRRDVAHPANSSYRSRQFGPIAGLDHKSQLRRGAVDFAIENVDDVDVGLRQGGGDASEHACPIGNLYPQLDLERAFRLRSPIDIDDAVRVLTKFLDVVANGAMNDQTLPR